VQPLGVQAETVLMSPMTVLMEATTVEREENSSRTGDTQHVTGDAVPLADRQFSYDDVGATRPADAVWSTRPRGYRAFERTVCVGHGQSLWDDASSVLLGWGVKTRSGFRIEPPPDQGRVRAGDRVWLRARMGRLSVSEPASVVDVVDQAYRRGFAYGTLEGHPVAGEEAFVLHRDADGSVWFTLRSLTRAPQGRWRLAFPAALIAQRWYRRRYERALVR
jgi:uncharacterized protein (UPF0548 family)